MTSDGINRVKMVLYILVEEVGFGGNYFTINGYFIYDAITVLW